MSKPSGQVFLVKNAIVDRNYGHTIDFKSPSEQLAYWGSLIKYSVDKELYSYIRRETQQITVPYKLDEIQDVNYLYYKASENSKMYYCFVDDKKYLSETASTIYFHTDVLQTYMFDYEVKQSYVLQEHTDRWDANHKPIYSRTEEGLDYGSEYTIESGYKIEPNQEKDTQYYLAICTQHNHLVGSGNSTNATEIADICLPYYFYLLAHDKRASDSGYTKWAVKIDENDATMVGGLYEFMQKMSSGVLGNFVKQIIRLPYLPFKYKADEGMEYTNIDLTGENSVDFAITGIKIDDTAEVNFLAINKIKKNYEFVKKLAEMNVFEGVESALPTDEQWAKVESNPYSIERDKRFESKLLCYPYRYNLLTDWKSNPVIIKNEYIGSDKIKLNYTQGVSFNSPVRYWIENYKKDPEGRGTSLVQLTPDEIPVVSDAYYTYMLQNKNQIQANQTNAIVSGAVNTGMGVVNGARSGGLVGAIFGGLNSGVDSAVNLQNMIRSENAKQKDLKNLPDSIINSNDCGFTLFDNNKHISFYRYKICCEFEELLADTFNITGYTVKRVKKPDLKSRLRFNYIKTVGANIVGSFDQSDLTLIKQIFDNGVTFWHYNTVNFKPFDYSLENIETKLIKG